MLKILNFNRRLSSRIIDLVEFTNRTFSQNILITEDEEENDYLLCFCEENNKLEAFYYLGLGYGYLQHTNALPPLKEIKDELKFCFCCTDNPVFTIQLFTMQPLVFIEHLFALVSDLRGVTLTRGQYIHAEITMTTPDDISGLFYLGFAMKYTIVESISELL
jgi:hypothetical protein